MLAVLCTTAACGEHEPLAPSALPPAAGLLRGVVTNAAGSPLPASLTIVDSAGSRRSTLAGASGDFRFDAVPGGRAVLSIAAKGYQTMESPIMVDGPASVSFVLQPLPKVTLSGIVADIDTGAAIAGALVTILADPTTEGPADWGRTATTDSLGQFAFENITRGNANLSATAAGYQERRDGVNTGVRTTLNFGLRRLPAPESFTGQLQGTAVQPFEMRRPGIVDLMVTWEGGTDTSLQVQLVHQIFGTVKDVRGAAGGGRRITFSQSAPWAGAWSVRIVDLERVSPVPFTVTLTRWD